MTKIIVSVRDQHLVLTKLPLIASGDIESDAIEFQFDSNWDGYTKTAIFYNSKETVYSKLIGDDGIVTIPSECMRSEGYFYFGVLGVDGDKRKTSDCARYKVEKGAITEATPAPEPTPDIYQQILEYIAQLGTTKLSINQGVEHAGKGMIVDGEGNISPMTLPTGTVVIDPTLSIPEQAAEAKATGDAIADATEDVNVLKNESKKQAKDIHNLKELAKGKIYTVDVDSDVAITKVVPAGAARYAELEKWGGKTGVWNQLIDGTEVIGSRQGISITSNGNGTYILNGSSSTGSTVYIRVGTASALQTISGIKYLLIGCPAGGGAQTYWLYNDNKGLTDVGAGGAVGASTGNGSIYICVAAGYTCDNLVFAPRLVNLTRMYGSGNEPNSRDDERIVALKAYLDEHPEYDAGTLVSADVSGIKTVGKNRYTAEEIKSAFVAGGASVVDESHIRFGAWDVDNSTFFANFMPNTQYVITLYGSNDSGGFTNTRVWYDDGTWQLIPDFENGVASLITGSSKSVVSIGGRWNDGYTTIDVSKSSICVGTTPVPYHSAIVPVPAAVHALDGYGWSAGSAYNSVEWDAAQKKWFYHKRVGSVDMGTLYFSNLIHRDSERSNSSTITSYIKHDTVNIISTRYISNRTVIGANTLNLAIAVSSGSIYLRDDELDGRPYGKQELLNGVMLYFELATEVVTDITDLMGGYDGTLDTEQGGSVEFVQSNTPALAVPSTVNYMIKLEEAI